MTSEKVYIQNLSDFVSRIDEICEYKRQANLRYWFRGQPDSAYRLEPGVCREDFIKDVPIEADDKKKKEKFRLKKEQLQAKEFEARASSLIEGEFTDSRLYFLMQHYGMQTRLLDWSTNALVGLYFATEEKVSYKKVDGVKGYTKVDSDGKLFFMDVYGLDNEDANLKGIASKRHPIFKQALEPIFNWHDSDENFPKIIFPVIPDSFDKRIILQRGCFTFHVPNAPILTANENPTLKDFSIKAEHKLSIRKQLSHLGIDKSSIYGDLPSLAETIKNFNY